MVHANASASASASASARMADDLPPLINLSLKDKPPSGDTPGDAGDKGDKGDAGDAGPMDLSEYTAVTSGVELEEGEVYVATRKSKGCGDVQIKFRCVKTYAFKPGELGNEVLVLSIYTTTDYTGKDSSKSRCVYRRKLKVNSMVHFYRPYFMFPDGDIMFGQFSRWKLYKITS